jgi:hypothetical protein
MNTTTRRIDPATLQKHRISEGSESAARIAKRLESECGFGACSGHPDCRDRQCPEHPCKTGMLGLPVLDTMTDDRFNLHRPVVDGKTGLIVSHVDTSAMDRKDCMSFGGLDHLPVEMIEPIRSVKVWAEHLKTAALVVAAGLALACTFYVSTL